MLIEALCKANVLQFGRFTLKSGLISPFYLDLRLTASYPQVLKQIAQAMGELLPRCQFDLLCGVPYTAIPFATALCLSYNVPMLLKRKEKKAHGTGKMVEGVFQAGQKCLVIEDVISSGQSILETISALEKEGLKVYDVIVLVDREQGGRQKLEEKGVCLHSVLTLTHIIDTLEKQGKISDDQVSSLLQFIQR